MTPEGRARVWEAFVGALRVRRLPDYQYISAPEAEDLQAALTAALTAADAAAQVETCEGIRHTDERMVVSSHGFIPVPGGTGRRVVTSHCPRCPAAGTP